MKVLSLFDGISCGMLALQDAGIKIDTYYASEIEESAIQISKIDIVIGGSPCQGFSRNGK